MATPERVVVVGGGPAGLATAIACRREGLEVVVVDPGEPPRDKACGEGLMPDALEVLDGLGVELPAGAGRPFHGIRWVDGGRVAEGHFAGRPGRGLRRTVLHAALVARAEAVGVELAWGVRATGLAAAGGVETTAGEVPGRWVVGADGLGSRVRSWAGLERPAGRRRRAGRRLGLRRHFAAEPWSDLVEVHWAAGCEAYVTPVAGREVGVAMLWSGPPAGFDALLGRFPALAARLAGAAASSRDRGAGPLYRRPRAVWRGHVALVGDAAGYIDAITGEGLAVAFHQALALAEALAVHHLPSYGREHFRIMALPAAVTHLLLVAEGRPALRRRLLATFAADRELFERFLAIHARQRPPRHLGLGGAWRLVRGLLARPG